MIQNTSVPSQLLGKMKSIIEVAINSIERTNLHSSHVCIVVRGKKIKTITGNDDGNRILGISVPSRHAEMNAICNLRKTKNATKKKYCEKLGYLCNKSR